MARRKRIRPRRRAETIVVVNGWVLRIPMRSRAMPRPRVTRKRVYYGNGYDDWRRKAILMLRSLWTQNGQPVLEPPYTVSIAIDTRKGDLDNHIKTWLDVLEHAGIIHDDRHVWRIEAVVNAAPTTHR